MTMVISTVLQTGRSCRSLASRRPSIMTVVACALLMCCVAPAHSQSTYGSVLGTVRDASGRVIPGCTVVLTNTGTGSVRQESTSGDDGSYAFRDAPPGAYEVTISAQGFQTTQFVALDLQAREVKRLDATLKIATLLQSVEVRADTGVIETEISYLSETKTGRELTDLPIAITSRASGSTSPLSTLTTQPGIQTDDSSNISVFGAKPSMLSVTLDGIASMGPQQSAPLSEVFPSFNAISEIRVSELNNGAEYGGVSDITTISKSGTNTYHGGAFEIWQNRDLNAQNPFSLRKAALNMNNFGAYVGGPVSLPWLYNGRNRTFFFTSYEGLRLPKQTTKVESVPSLALRSGILSAYSGTIYDPNTGLAYSNNQIPSTEISTLSLAALQYLYPLPNTGAENAIGNNYTKNFDTPVMSDQGDLRVDQNFGSKQSVFFRGNYKNRNVAVAMGGSALRGSLFEPEIDYGVTIGHSYMFTPSLLNEIRTGFTGNRTSISSGIAASTIATELSLTGLSVPPGDSVPGFGISGFQGTGGSASTTKGNNTAQVIDNVTWTKQKHTMKYGGDFRRMRANITNIFGGVRLGIYNFTGAVTSQPAEGSTHAYIGNPFAAFLLGIPDSTELATITQPNSFGYANAYALYVQDDWRLSTNLTLNFGLRWEYHPMFNDHLGNTSNFLPDYASIQNGVYVHGAVVLPDEASFGILNPAFAAAISPTPILTAAQAGIPASLRYSVKTDFGPRFGVAWRPFGNNRTVIRGGFGKYFEGPLGGLLVAGRAIHSVNDGVYSQSIVNNQAALTFPYPFPSNLSQPGSQWFEQAADLHYVDPSVYQWNATIETDIGYKTALQLSYIGSHGAKLTIQGNINEVPPNTIGYSAAKAFAPYPLWEEVEIQTNGGRSNYNAVSVSAKRRFVKGVQYEASYIYSRNLTNAQGFAPTNSFADEAGGFRTDLRQPNLDYGNVAWTRRHRFLATGLYQLPFGRRGSYLAKANRAIDSVVGGWELSGVVMVQSGPFLTATVDGADPSGTGFPNIVGAGRPDRVAGVPFVLANRSKSQWLNPAAFAVPANNIGRFGNLPVGSIPGIGSEVVSVSLIKAVTLKEGIVFQFGAQAANVFNHVNYDQPNLSFNTSSFGSITNVQSAEGAGPRAIQITGRLTF